MMRTIAAFAAAAAVIAGPAIAGETAPLTTETATRFVATLGGVQARITSTLGRPVRVVPVQQV